MDLTKKNEINEGNVEAKLDENFEVPTPIETVTDNNVIGDGSSETEPADVEPEVPPPAIVERPKRTKKCPPGCHERTRCAKKSKKNIPTIVKGGKRSKKNRKSKKSKKSKK